MVNATAPVALNGHSNGHSSSHTSPGIDGTNGKPEVDGEGEKSANLPPPEVAAAIPCRFFPLGTCKYGDACAFSHTPGPAPAEDPASSPTSSAAAVSAGQASSPPLMPASTASVDYSGYPMGPVAQPFFYYGMPQQYYPPMPYPAYVDANGYPIPIMGQPYVDFTSQQAAGGITVATTQAGTSPGGVSSLPEGIESPRLMEAHPGLAEHMAALSMAQSQMSPTLSPFPMSPTMLPQGMAQLPPAFSERGNAAYFGANGQPRPRQSMSGSPRRSSTVGADPNVRTASAIISFPTPASPISPMSPSSRSFGSHSRFSTEPGSRGTMRDGKERSSNFPCAFFPDNRCRNGDQCKYTHLLPSGQDARTLGKGIIGIDGRNANPAEPSKSFTFPAGRGRGSGMRGGGSRGNGLGRSYGPSRASFGAYGLDELQGGVMTDGNEPARRYVDDEARERVERFIESTRASGMGGRPQKTSPSPMSNGMGQKVPSVGDFPALANDAASPTSPKINGVHTHEQHHASTTQNGDSQPLASKLASSFASAAARAVKATSTPSSGAVTKTPASPVAETTALSPVAVGAAA